MVRNVKVFELDREFDYTEKINVLLSTYHKENYLIMKKKEIDIIDKFTIERGIDKLQDNKSVYFCPSSEISRSKFREWARHKGVKVVYNMNKADVIVFSKKSISGLLDQIKADSFHKLDPRYVTVKTRNLELVPTSCIVKDTYGDLISTDTSVDSRGSLYIEFDSYNDIITNNNNTWRNSTSDNTMCYVEKEKSTPRSELYYCINRYNRTFIDKSIDNIIETLYTVDRSVVNFMDEEDVLNNMNELVMDMDSFLTCKDFLNSEEKDNLTVGFEMLTNYNFSKSLFYLGLLKMCCASFQDNLRYKSHLSVRLKPLYEFNKAYLGEIKCCLSDYYRNGDFFENFDRLYKMCFESSSAPVTPEMLLSIEESFKWFINESMQNIKIDRLALNENTIKNFKRPAKFKLVSEEEGIEEESDELQTVE